MTATGETPEKSQTFNATKDFQQREAARIAARMALVPTYKIQGPTPVNHATICTAFRCNWVAGVGADMDKDECARKAM